MEITIDLELSRILIHFDKHNSYALMTIKWSGETIRMSIPYLITVLRNISESHAP